MKYVLSLLENNQIFKIKEIVSEKNPIDIAEFFEGLPKDSTLRLFRLLPKDTASEVFSYLSSEKQQEIIERISDEEISNILKDMFLDDTVDLIEEMPAEIVAKILHNSTPETRQLINQFFKYPEDSAGGIMTVEYVSLKRDMSITQALNHIRKVGWKNETIHNCYVTRSDRKLVGTVSIKDLILNPSNTILEDIMDSNVVSVTTTDDQEYVASLFRKYDLTSMPVVDKENRLVGIITVDDIVDIIDQENTEDFHKMAAMEPSDKEYLKESVFSLAKNRIIWLLVLMISATATGIIIRKYEAVLQSVVILAAFIPMLMDTGGNAGSQSSTLIIRGLALGEVNLKDGWKIVWKELRVSLLVGLVLSILNFVRILVFDKVDIKIAAVVCASLFLTVVIAKVVGGILPIGAKALKLDPAIMASPLITTIVDACALFIYFALAVNFLGIA